MADPLTILGSVAASVQLVQVAAGALLGTVKFARELREIPKKTATQLEDVDRSAERVQHVCTQTLATGSVLFDQLEPAQRLRLSRCAENVRVAIDEAQAVLEPIVNGHSSVKVRPLRRLWRAVVSVTKEGLIAEKLERVDKLNLEMLRELQIASLKIQAEMRPKVLETLSKVQTCHIDSLGRLDVVLESTRELRSIIHDNQHAISTDIRSLVLSNEDISLTTSEIYSHMKELSLSMRSLEEVSSTISQKTADLGNDLQGEYRMSHRDIQSMIRRQEAKTSSELRLLRDQLMGALVGLQNSDSLRPQIGDPDLTPEARRTLEVDTRIVLIRYPAALQTAWDNSVRSRQRFKPCRCRPSTEYSTTKVWNWRFEAVNKFSHRKSCPYRRNGGYFWAYSLYANLHPFLNRTMELTLGAATGPGGWCMAPPLRFRKTVKRSGSSVFRAFDMLPDMCCIKRYNSSEQDKRNQICWIRDKTSFNRLHSFYLTWLPCTAEHLRSLNQLLRVELAQGTFSGLESDESGSTILFELFHVVILLGNQWINFQVELEELLSTILSSSVDIEATSKAGNTHRQYNHTPFWSKIGTEYTATRYLLQNSFRFRIGDGTGVPFYQRLVATDMLDTLRDISSGPFTVWDIKASPIDLLVRNFEVAEAADYDDLSLAIIKRSKSQLSYFVKTNRQPDILKPHHLTHLQLALGWAEGTSYLTKMNYPAVRAIVSACHKYDTDSLRLLMKTGQAIFAKETDQSFFPHPLWIFRESSKSQNHAIQQIVVSEFKKRRLRLINLFLYTFGEDSLEKMGMNITKAMGEDAISVYNQLQKRISIPEALDCCQMASPYHLPPTPTLSILESIYNAGFVAVGTKDGAGVTPLIQILSQNERIAYYDGSEELAEWFIKHGAAPENDIVGDWPSILFFLAISGSFGINDMDSVGSHHARIAARELHLKADSCDCFCSTNGCLPTHLLFRCHNTNSPWTGLQPCRVAKNRYGILGKWTKRWAPSAHDEQVIYRESCQLELFDRLGMTHTCCIPDRSFQKLPFSSTVSLSKSEIAQIQSENADLADQLDSLMAQYDLARGKRSGDITAFQEFWWEVVDQILPPLLNEEARHLIGCVRWKTGEYLLKYDSIACQRDALAISNRRSHREKEALHMSGYGHFENFEDVINVHFSKQDWTARKTWTEHSSSDAQ